MENHKDRKKIIVGLANPKYKQIEPEKKFTDDFLEKQYTIEEELRQKLLMPINDKIGLHNWALFFGNVYRTDNYLVDVYTESDEAFGLIKNILDEKLPSLTLSFRRMDYSAYNENI